MKHRIFTLKWGHPLALMSVIFAIFVRCVCCCFSLFVVKCCVVLCCVVLCCVVLFSRVVDLFACCYS